MNLDARMVGERERFPRLAYQAADGPIDSRVA